MIEPEVMFVLSGSHEIVLVLISTKILNFHSIFFFFFFKYFLSCHVCLWYGTARDILFPYYI